MEIRGTLTDWTYNGKTIVGYIFDDTRQRFPDGASIITSRVITPREEVIEGAVVETLNSFYQLGKPQYQRSPVVTINNGKGVNANG
jgi:hypothetical protein